MERNKSAKIKNSAEKSSGEILPRDTEGNLMKSVAQTIIEADRFYTIAAKTGSVIQAVESVKDGGNIRLGKYERKPEQEWAFVREGDGVYRIRNRASGKLIDLMMTGTANGTWLHLWEDVGGTSQMWKMEPPRPAPSACAPCGCRKVHRHRGHGYCGRRCAPDLAGDCRRGPAVDHLRGEGPRKARPQGGGKAR